MLVEKDYKNLCEYTISHYTVIKQVGDTVHYQLDPEADTEIYEFCSYKKLFDTLLKDDFVETMVDLGYLEEQKNESEDEYAMTNLSYQVIEDNSGGLHMAVFDVDGSVRWMHSGYQYHEQDLLSDIEKIRAGEDPAVDGWEADEVNRQELYDEIMSYTNGYEVIADTDSVYAELMGNAGQRAFGIQKDEILFSEQQKDMSWDELYEYSDRYIAEWHLIETPTQSRTRGR